MQQALGLSPIHNAKITSPQGLSSSGFCVCISTGPRRVMCIAGRSTQGRDRFQREKASGGGDLNAHGAGNARTWKKGDDRVREGAGGRGIIDNKKEQRRTYIPRFEPNVSSHRAGKMHFELSELLILSLFV